VLEKLKNYYPKYCQLRKEYLEKELIKEGEK
jgi:hypothetical protein